MAKKNGSSIEWVGGVLSMPAYVMDEDVPYRPTMVIWMNADGFVLGLTPTKPNESLPVVASDSLQTAIKDHHAPARIRISSNEVAEALRISHPQLEIIIAPTPELDEVFEHMSDELGQGERAMSYLSSGIEPDAIASFFTSATKLYEAEPWKIVPSDQSLFFVTIEQLNIRDAVLSVIGQMEQNFGIVLFSNIDDFHSYLEVGYMMEHDEVPESIAPHLSLNFDKGADIDTELRKEIATYSWEVSDSKAYPYLLFVDKDLLSRPLTIKEYTIIEAIALALSEILLEKEALHAAWEGRSSVCQTFTVPTYQGNIEVNLRVT